MGALMQTVSGTSVFGLLGSLLVLSSGSIASAATSVPYQRYLNGSCPGLTCFIDFPPVPAGKRLEITNASCYIRETTSTDLFAAQLITKTSGGGNVSAVTLTPVLVDTGPSYRHYASSDEVFIFAGATQHIQAYVEITAGAFQQVACSIGGHLITP